MNNICKNKTKKLAKNINIQHFFLLEMNKVNWKVEKEKFKKAPNYYLG